MTARLALGLLVAALIALVVPGVAAADIFNVNTTADHDDKSCTIADCTLREAVQEGGSGDTINVPSGNYVLTTSNELVLSADTIVGVGARTTFIDGGDKTRVLRVAGEGTSRVSGVTIRNGNGASTTSNGSGGGIFQQSSTLMLTNVTVSGNSAAAIGGGGIVVVAGVMTMIGSTVSGNTAGTGRLTRAGGIFVNTGANALLANSTISGNIARDVPGPADASEGGGIYAAGSLTLINMTIAGNTAASGGGLYQQPPSASGPSVATSMSNTILAGNSGAECAGPGIEPPSAITSHHDVVDDGSCMLTGAGEKQDVNPLLGPLADNGGQTNTRALAVNSPAIDAGSGCAALDQRGVARPGGSACDPGAFEFMPPTLAVTTTVINDNGGTRNASGFLVHVKQGAVEAPKSPQNGNANGFTFTLTPGAYTVSVDDVTGYSATISGDCDAKGGVALAENQAKACTITLNDIAPTLRVITTVTNDNGGTRTASGFSAHVKSGATDVAGSPQAGSTSGTTYTLPAGTYAVSADPVAGYTLSVSAGCGAVVLVVGDAKTCTVTANDIAPTLTVVTSAINDNGGTRTAGGFSAHVRSGGVDVATSPQAGSATGTTYSLTPGTYAVSADPVTGYALSVSAGCGAVVLAVGDARTCTITANDVAPTLTVVTTVINDNGGTRLASGFSAHVKSGATDVAGSPQAGSTAGTLYTLSAGTYAVSADSVTGYTLTVSAGCGAVVLVVGDVKTCTITADDIAPRLTVVTTVINDNGGTRLASGFSAHVKSGGVDVATSPQAGSATGTTYTLSPGTYAVSADPVTGYTLTVSAGCGAVVLVVGDVKTCTITADDIAPRLTVVTTVTNDNGGTRTPSGFSAHVKSGATDVAGSPQPGSTTGTLYTLTPGTYAVSADPVTGYALTVSAGCGAVVLALGDVKTCTITADDVAPTLTVTTTVTNDNGGTRTPSGFSAHVKSGGVDVATSPQAGSASGTTYTLNAGTYAVSADSVTGYTLAVSAGCGAVVLVVGDVKTCTITANDVAPKLRVSAAVVNNNGGASDVDDFLVHVRSGGTDVAGSPAAGSTNGTQYTLAAGGYAVSGDGGSSYAVTVSGDCAASGAIALQVGDDRACTVTFDDIAPTLRVVTTVVNDNGGTRTPSGFSAHVKSGGGDVATSPQPGSATGTTYTLNAGTYAVSADPVSGYTLSVSAGCGAVTLAVGDVTTCTITADDIAPTLRVVTHVVNNDGRTKVASNFSAHVKSAGVDVDGSPQPGSESPGTLYTLDAGTYAVSADLVTGYALSVSAGCGAVALAVGDAKTCTITADDVTSSLTVVTAVVNDNGGTRTPSDFSAHVKSAGADVLNSPAPGDSTTGTTYSLEAGDYAVSTDAVPGYTTSMTGDCAPTGAITLALGQARTCTVTANDVAPTLTVVKQVVNDNGGTRAPADFSLHVKRAGADVADSPAPGTASGRTYTLAAGTYAVSEDAVAGYLGTISGACAPDGTVTLKEGDARTCTITNDDLAQVGSQQLPAPVAAKAVNLLPKTGTVKIKLPGTSTFVLLEEGKQIPVGTIVDALKGRVTLVAAADKGGGTATADFYGGIFKVGQTKGAKPITTLKLVEKLSCKKSGKASAAAKKKKKRRLWGDGKGKFRTNGSYSSATVRGTKWLVEDRCTSTRTKVARGKVAVRDFVKRKTVIVKAGKKYVARARG